MGKSLTATLVGRLVADGRLSLDQPAPVPAWQHPDDPRRAITIRDLLQMSSGLRMSGHNDPRSSWPGAVPEHFYVYMEAIDTFDFAISRPPEFPPQTVGRYRNCDPLTLGYIAKQLVQDAPDRTTSPGRNRRCSTSSASGARCWTRISSATSSCRAWTTAPPATGRGWACSTSRMACGRARACCREGWSRFVGTPAPAWPQPVYGGQFWLNRTGEFDLPKDTYMMAGSGQQRVFIVPSADLVVVRLGHARGHDHAAPSINAMLRSIMGCLPA